MITTAALLEVRDVTVQYPRGRKQQPLVALEGASLAVNPGETVALVGESGSGKSTLGNAILGLVAPTAGTILFRGEDIAHAKKRRRRELTQEIQVVFQDPFGSLNPVRTIGQTLIEPLRAHKVYDAAAARSHVAAALERVGLDASAAQRYPAQFSGGQRQRIAIARALMLEPRLIVCDEPTSSLDLSIQGQLINLLIELQRDLGVSYLFITHDLAIVRHIAQRVVVLQRGRIVEEGLTNQVCSSPRHSYTRALIAAAPVPDPVEQRRKREGAQPSPAPSHEDDSTGSSAEPPSPRPDAYSRKCPADLPLRAPTAPSTATRKHPAAVPPIPGNNRPV